MKNLSLWAAIDSIQQLANTSPAWSGDENQLIDTILDIAHAKISQARREWLIAELATSEVQNILYRRGVFFLFDKHDYRVTLGPGVRLGGR